MDDSGQDFADLCSKLLKRVRKKTDGTTVARKTDLKSSTQTSGRDTTKRRNKDIHSSVTRTGGVVSGTQSVSSSSSTGDHKPPSIQTDDPKQPVVSEILKHESEDVTGPSSPVDSGDFKTSDNVKGGLRAKGKVLIKMQQFKRVSPQKLTYNQKTEPHRTDDHSAPPSSSDQGSPTPSTSGLQHVEPQDDEALARRLQQELDREAAESQPIDLEEGGGLFFCQLCQKDLSHMTPDGRTQHLNRCLDESEHQAPALPPPPSVPDCPICGKRFKSQKSRSAHLKRCSSDLGVAPAMLVQALHRQAAEAQGDRTANQRAQAAVSKRKGPSDSVPPAQKKPRRKAQRLDEDTVVALALSSSLMGQEKERERRERELLSDPTAPLTSGPSLLPWRPDAAKSRGKRRKGVVPRPPPLLLVQDAEVALKRLQERVTSLLLDHRGPSPPTPTRCPSSLPSQNGTAPLWQKSALRDGGPSCVSEFYTPELKEFIVPSQSTTADVLSKSKDKAAKPVLSASREGTPLSAAKRSILPSILQTGHSPAPSSPGTGQSLVGSQTLNDLMELADEGMTLTQWGYCTSVPSKELRPSGFQPVESGPASDLPLSGFIPDAPHDRSPASSSRPLGTRTDAHKSVLLSRLVSDLSSMVNSPKLSDLQLQVDTGEVFFAHSFMVYARCPLLAQMVRDSGIGVVQEEGLPAAQRVVIGDVPGQAVYALLQFLYTAWCSITPALLPHVQELASRFDLEELQQLCQLHPAQAELQGGVEGDDSLGQEHCAVAEEGQRDQAFLELLRSMWNEEDEDDNDDERGTDEGSGGEMRLEESGDGEDVTTGDRELHEEQVNEEEMEEIYEFAATQRKRGEEEDSREEEEGADEDENGVLIVEEDHSVPKPGAVGPESISTGSKEQSPDPISRYPVDRSLDRSYSRLFSITWGEYEPESSTPASAPHPPKTTVSHSPHKLSSRPDKGKKESVSRCLQSSESEVIDLSSSPTTSMCNPPKAGLSPGAESEGREIDECLEVTEDISSKERLSPKRESQGPRSICAPPSQVCNRKEPELVVLSDSSEDMELAIDPDSPLYSPLPSPNQNIKNPSEDMELAVDPDSPLYSPPPSPNQSIKNHTQIKPWPNPEPNEPTLLTSSPECGTDAPMTDILRPGTSRDDLDQNDCSPEVSWLIPSTPVQHRTSSSSSTQTHSSMCRTQLFPKASSSSMSSSSSAFSSSCPSSFKDRPQTSREPHRVPLDVPQTETISPRPRCNRSSSHTSSLNLSSSPKRYNSSETDKDRAVSVVTASSSQSRQLPVIPLCDASEREAPTSNLQPYSSTPLHPNVPVLPSLAEPSPLLTAPDREGSSDRGRRRFSESPEEKGLGALHLSLSDTSCSKSLSPHKVSHSPPGASVSFSQSRLSTSDPRQSGSETDSHRKIPGSELTDTAGGKPKETGSQEREVGDEMEDVGAGTKEAQGEDVSVRKEENEEANVSASSFCMSFTAMDEPPIAFDNLWDVHSEGDQGACFSLRMEDSGGVSPLERSLGGEEMARTSSPTFSPPQTSAATQTIRPITACNLSPLCKSRDSRPLLSPPTTPKSHRHGGPSISPSPPEPTTHSSPEVNASILDSKIWDEWDNEEEEEVLPLIQRVNAVVPNERVAQLKTPVTSRDKKRGPLVPITPMPSYSDMDTPDLKNKLNRFGVRALPKRQMILKLKEIHQYTHQLMSSESEDETGALGHLTQKNAPPVRDPGSKPVSSSQAPKFKQPRAPPVVSPVKHGINNDEEPLSLSQGSNTSSTAASEDSEKSNPELCFSSDGDSDSDGGFTASQAASRHEERLQAVRSFILSDTELHSQVLQYQPLVLSHLQARLKAAGIRLGAARLLDYLDSQCITFTTAKPGQAANGRRRGRGRGVGKGSKATGRGGVRGRKRGGAASID